MQKHNAIHSEKIYWNNQTVDNKDLRRKGNMALQWNMMKCELTEGKSEVEKKNKSISKMITFKSSTK